MYLSLEIIFVLSDKKPVECAKYVISFHSNKSPFLLIGILLPLVFENSIFFFPFLKNKTENKNSLISSFSPISYCICLFAIHLLFTSKPLPLTLPYSLYFLLPISSINRKPKQYTHSKRSHLNYPYVSSLNLSSIHVIQDPSISVFKTGSNFL